jgi:subtilisin-like proprotein convertase family protein
MNDYISSDARGTEHRNGEIWSSALREVFLSFVAADGVAAGRRNADRLVVESIFGLTTGTSFYAAARQLILADGSLYGGAHAGSICAAMTTRGIFTGADCGAGPRGETTLFVASENREIPDVDLTGLTFTKVINEDRIIDQIQVRVAIEHTYRGDLRLSLTGPNGVTVLLQANSTDSANDLRVTYGLDTQSRESLDVFRGISARGEWKLQIADVARGDIGNLLSWALIIRFSGDTPITERSFAPGPTRHIVRVADAQGVQEDIRLFNRGSQDANVTIFYTARNTNGATEFAAVKVMIAPGQIVALEDVVSADLRTTGTGNLEFRGDIDDVLITSRTVNESDEGTHGEVVRSISSTEAIARSDAPIFVPHLRSSSPFSSTIGITETAGFSAAVELITRDQNGNASAPLILTIQPWSTVEQAVFTGTAVPIGRAELRVLSGDGRILAYGVVRDAASGDAMHVPAVKPITELTHFIPVAARTSGLRNTVWRTELALTNASASSTQNILVTLEPDSGDPITRSAVLPPGRSVIYEDVIESLFSRSAAAGKLVVHTASPQELVVTSRTWTRADGDFGEFVPSRRFAESTGRGERLVNAINLENSTALRTNIGLTEIVGNDMTVRIRIFDAQNHQIFTTDQYVGPRGHVQFNLANAGAPELFSGRASFEVIDGAGRLFGYASVIDNASDDPVYIAAE